MKRQRLLLASFIGLMLLALGGCEAKPEVSPLGLPVVRMTIGTKSFDLEVANDECSRDHGLMERDSIPADHGMVFVFEDETPRQFWMKNTRIPLDILFLDHTGRVVSTATMRPYDLSIVPSNEPAKYAIELNVGQIAATGVKPGDALSLPNFPAMPTTAR